MESGKHGENRSTRHDVAANDAPYEYALESIGKWKRDAPWQRRQYARVRSRDAAHKKQAGEERER